MYMTCVKNPYFTGVVENQVSNSRVLVLPNVFFDIMKDFIF